MDYKAVIRADDKNWKADCRKFMESKTQFVVINLSTEALRDGVALAQEFDYRCTVEDTGEYREIVINSYPSNLPTKIGFSPITKEYLQHFDN